MLTASEYVHYTNGEMKSNVILEERYCFRISLNDFYLKLSSECSENEYKISKGTNRSFPLPQFSICIH